MLSQLHTPSGHNAYSGFLHVEHAYNNPVVHVFVSLMTELALSVPNGDRYTPDQDLVYGAEGECVYVCVCVCVCVCV